MAHVSRSALGVLSLVRRGAAAVRPSAAAAFSSHPDFAPRVKAPGAAAAAPATQGAGASAARVTELIKAKPVVLFMKGSPAQPQCGFSAQVVRILHHHGEERGGWGCRG
jgi:hypothetical protein